MDKISAPKGKKSPALARVVLMLGVFCIPLTLALVMHGSLLGYVPGAVKSSGADITHAGAEVVINTTEIGKDISGYGGPVPVKIYVTDGKIDSVVPLPNSESPSFFSRLERGGLTKRWDGRSLEEAADMEVDGVSGATYSSRAFIANVQAGAAYASGAKAESPATDVSLGAIAAVIVIIAGAVLPFCIHKPGYRIVQQLLNVAVLGFWAGTFIDYSMLTGFLASKPHFSLASLTTVILLIVGFVYPAFGKAGHYCAWICPFGSLQELAGKVVKKKWRLSPALVRRLDWFRQALWVVLLVLLYAGWATAWIDYEVFTAFIVTSASWIVLAVGGAFVVLSLFINRPFCRFVCPTGTLLKDA